MVFPVFLNFGGFNLGDLIANYFSNARSFPNYQLIIYIHRCTPPQAYHGGPNWSQALDLTQLHSQQNVRFLLCFLKTVLSTNGVMNHIASMCPCLGEIFTCY